MSVDFALRAPWYERERGPFDLRDPQALRPTLQMYGDSNFVDRLLADPRDSMAFGDVDLWSYPIPIDPTKAQGRERFATHTLYVTQMRKLFQPIHERFYTVVVEVFCDQPGLPRAGNHDDLELRFVMRRRKLTVEGDTRQLRRLARKLIAERTKAQSLAWTKCTSADSPDLSTAELVWHRRFTADQAELLDAVSATETVQAWMINADGGVWRDVSAPPPAEEPDRREEEFPMWRLPDSAALCEAGKSRSLWFGVVPTFSDEHWIGPSTPKLDKPTSAKLDEHEIYELVCFARQPPEPGREHCAPRIWRSAPTQPFRLAAPFDPDGTQNHTVTITAPDLRQLAARAGQKLGSGGVRIVTPPGSALPPVKFSDIPGGSPGSPGVGGTVCVFAFELFFLVALFLFLLFLPIVVFLFQLWWLLALRFCLPPGAIDILKTFLQDGTKDLGNLGTTQEAALDTAVGIPGSAKLLTDAPLFPKPAGQSTALRDLVTAMDPANAVAAPTPPTPAVKPDDPLCPPAAPP